jgi:hypothetical protein
MGGLERLRSVENFAFTGYGQQLYFEGGGNITGDVNSPPPLGGSQSVSARRERPWSKECERLASSS